MTGTKFEITDQWKDAGFKRSKKIQMWLVRQDMREKAKFGSRPTSVECCGLGELRIRAKFAEEANCYGSMIGPDFKCDGVLSLPEKSSLLCQESDLLLIRAYLQTPNCHHSPFLMQKLVMK